MKLFLSAFVALAAALIGAPATLAGHVSYALVGARLLGGTGYEAGADVAIAADGSIYVLGSSRTKSADNAGGGDILLAKFGPTGGPKWVRLLGGTGEDDPGGVAVGLDGSIYVTGTTNSPSVAGTDTRGPSDALLARYSPVGERDFVVLFGSEKEDGANDVAVAPNGSVYVAGSISGPGYSDMMLSRFGPNGNLQWRARRGGAGQDLASGVAVTEDAVYLAGETWSPKFLGHVNKGDGDAVLLRFTLKGTQAWARYYATTLIDRFNAVAVSTGDAVYAGGAADTPICCGAPSNFGDTLVVRYSDEGQRQWVDRRGTDDALDSVNGVVGSPRGGAYVVGHWQVEPFDGGDSTAFFSEYSIAPSLAIQRLVGGPKQDGAAGVAVAADGSVVVVGFTADPAGPKVTAGKFDIVVYRFRPRDTH